MCNKINLLTFLCKNTYHKAHTKGRKKMKKIFVLGIIVGAVSVYGARAELVETVTTTESDVVTVENPTITEPVAEPTVVATEPVAEPVVVQEEFDEVIEEEVPPEEEPEPEPVEEYPVPTEDIPD